MNQDPSEPVSINSSTSRPTSAFSARRFWILGLLIAELYWHFQLYVWVSPPPGKWDMGGVAGKMQFVIFLGLMTTAFLVLGMFRRIRAARIGLMILSIGAATLGLFVVSNRKDTSLSNSVFVHELIYVAFNSVVALLLFCVRHFHEHEEENETNSAA